MAVFDTIVNKMSLSTITQSQVLKATRFKLMKTTAPSNFCNTGARVLLKFANKKLLMVYSEQS